jgi:nucleoside-diphosphate-sugar epimerase
MPSGQIEETRVKILVTGGAGYVGNLLTEALLNEGHQVSILDNFLFGYDSILHFLTNPNLQVIKQDIRDDNRPYLQDNDVVFHLAGISGYPACEANPNSAYRINVQATEDIASKLSPDQLLIYASTTSLYGAAGTLCYEDSPVDVDNNLYSATKHQGETRVMERENSISLRWATVFGVSPRMRSGLLLNDFVERAVKERTLVLYSPKSKRTFMHVRDSVAGYLFALNHADQMRGQIFNMGDQRLNYSKMDLAEIINRHVEFEVIESSLSDKDIRDFLISYEKAAALGYECNISIEDGIAELVKLYRYYTPDSALRPI